MIALQIQLSARQSLFLFSGHTAKTWSQSLLQLSLATRLCSQQRYVTGRDVSHAQHYLHALTESSGPWQLRNSCTENSTASNQGPGMIQEAEQHPTPVTWNSRSPLPAHLKEFSSVTWRRKIFLLCLKDYRFEGYLLPQTTVTLIYMGKEDSKIITLSKRMHSLTMHVASKRMKCIDCLIKLNILRKYLQFRCSICGWNSERHFKNSEK